MFISYAQNFEDVVLWRALQHVEKGCYVDIGAQHPIIDSVSLAFYERGWRGIHIEPTPFHAELLRTHRPDETILELAVGNSSGSLTIFDIEGTGLSTADSALADEHNLRGYPAIPRTVACMTLDSAVANKTQHDIHWMKIDVEGMERSVIEGWNRKAIRPWIVLIESVRPWSHDETQHEWENLLLESEYRFAYFDGLNRFYVANEHPELIESFSVPPNIFDNFVLSENSFAVFALSAELQNLRSLKSELASMLLTSDGANRQVIDPKGHAPQAVDDQPDREATFASIDRLETRLVAAIGEVSAALEVLKSSSPTAMDFQFIRDSHDRLISASTRLGELEATQRAYRSEIDELRRALEAARNSGVIYRLKSLFRR